MPDKREHESRARLEQVLATARCPDCGGDCIVVTHTAKAVRYTRCKTCGGRGKITAAR